MSSERSGKVEPEKPYSNLARHYRQLMAHVDYAAWGAFLLKVLRQQGVAPRSLLELGAGNGMLCRHLCIPGLETRITSDLSLAMMADANPVFTGQRVVADARALPFRGNFDLVLMTYDALNYLDARGVRDLFKGVRSLLSAQGVFIFDVTTERNSLRYFHDVTDAIDVSGGVLVRRSWYDADECKQYNRFDLFEQGRGGNYRRTEELHCQNIYAFSELERMARSERLRVRASYGNFSLTPPGPNADRIHIVLEKV